MYYKFGNFSTSAIELNAYAELQIYALNFARALVYQMGIPIFEHYEGQSGRRKCMIIPFDIVKLWKIYLRLFLREQRKSFNVNLKSYLGGNS